MTKPRAALLIDGDNVNAKHLNAALNALASLCDVQDRLLFCDFVNAPNGWTSDVCDRHMISLVQHFRHSQHKNGTDIALAIEAMDLMHGGKVGAIAVMSSDSDYRALAVRLRQNNLTTICVGEAKSAPSLRNAFDHFVELETDAEPNANIVALPSARPAKPLPVKPEKTKKIPVQPTIKASKKTPVPRVVPAKLQRRIIKLMQELNGENEAILLAQIVKGLRDENPAFSPRAHGFANISKLLKSLDEVKLLDKNRAARLELAQPKTKKA